MGKSCSTRSKTKQLTPRQLALAKHLVGGSTITEAARKAGYSEKNLAQSGHQALKAIRLSVPELMDDVGLTERALIEKHLVPLLNAKSTKYFQHRGKVTDKRSVPDNDTRLKALDMSLRLRGSFPRDSQDDQSQIGVKVVIVDIPRPTPGAITDDIRPGQPIILSPQYGRNGHKPQE